MKNDNEYQDQAPVPENQPGWIPPDPGPRDDRRARPGPLGIALVAVIAAALGVAVALIITKGPYSATPVSAAPGSSPSAAAPGAGSSTAPQAGGGAGGLPPLSGGGGALQLMLNGRVTAVSATSITLGGNGPSVTAAITRSTHFTGSVRTAAGIKVGDQITAQVTGTNPQHLVAAEIPGSRAGAVTATLGRWPGLAAARPAAAGEERPCAYW